MNLLRKFRNIRPTDFVCLRATTIHLDILIHCHPSFSTSIKPKISTGLKHLVLGILLEHVHENRVWGTLLTNMRELVKCLKTYYLTLVIKSSQNHEIQLNWLAKDIGGCG